MRELREAETRAVNGGGFISRLVRFIIYINVSRYLRKHNWCIKIYRY